MSYLQFLNLLISLGPKLGQIIPLLLAAFDLFQQGIAKLGEIGKLVTPPAAPGAPPAPVAPIALSAMDINQAEFDAEQKVLAMSASGGIHASKLGDGAILRGLWQFVQQHPELLSLLLGLLKGAVPAA